MPYRMHPEIGSSGGRSYEQGRAVCGDAFRACLPILSADRRGSARVRSDDDRTTRREERGPRGGVPHAAPMGAAARNLDFSDSQ